MRYIWNSQRRRARGEVGFTLIELVIVLAILGILIALAVPRYLGARKRAYKAEAQNILQELKTLSWAYYNEKDTFSGITIAGLGFQMPAGSAWATPAVSATASDVVWTVSGSGAITVIGTGDSCNVTLRADGSSASSCSF